MLQKTMSNRIDILRDAYVRCLEDGTPISLIKLKLRTTGPALRNYIIYSKSKGLIPDDFKPSEVYRNVLSAKLMLLKELHLSWAEISRATSLAYSTIHDYLHNDEDVVFGIGKIRVRADAKIVTKQNEVQEGEIFDVTLLNEKGDIEIEGENCTFYGEVGDICHRITLLTCYPVMEDFVYPVEFKYKGKAVEVNIYGKYV